MNKRKLYNRSFTSAPTCKRKHVLRIFNNVYTNLVQHILNYLKINMLCIALTLSK